MTGKPVTASTSTGTSASVTATTAAGDLLLVVVGGEGDGLLQQSGTPLSTLLNVTYSECGSDVIASAGMFAAFPGVGAQTVTISGITYPTNSGTSMGVAAYVLAPTTTPPPVPPAAACSTSPASAVPGQSRPHLITALATPTAPPAAAAAGTPYQGSYCVVAEVLDASGAPVAGTAVTFDVTTPTGGFSTTKSTDNAGGAAIVVPSSGSLTASTTVNIVSGSVSTSIGVTENWLPGDHTNAMVGLGIAGQSITWPARSAAEDGLCYTNAYLTTTTTSSCQRVYRSDGWGTKGQPVSMPAAATTICQAFDAVTTVLSCAATALTPAVCLLGAETGPLACGAYIAGITDLGLPVQCAEALAGALGDAITADHGPSSAISAADFSTISPQDIRTPKGASSGIQDVVGVACTVVPVLKLTPTQIPQPTNGATTTQVTLAVNGVTIPNAVASLTFMPAFAGGGSQAEVILGGRSFPLSAAPLTLAFDSSDDPIQISYTYPTSALYKELTLTDIITAIPADSLAGTLTPTASYTSKGARQPPCGPTICSSAANADVGQSVNITARGFTPGSLVTFLIESAPRLLGRVSASTSGTAQLTFAVPQAASSGMHVVSAVGETAHGKILSRSIVLTVRPAQGSSRTWVIVVVGLLALALLAGMAWLAAAMKRQRLSRVQQ